MVTTDIIEKLIQLALKNPNREEAAAAALKAVSLIDKFQIPIGSEVHITRDAPEWRPPSEDFMQTVEDILSGKNRRPGGATVPPRSQGGPGYANALSITDNETTTREEAWRLRMIDAWREIREERKRFEGIVQRGEQEKHERFWGFPCRQCGADNKKPWM